VTPKKNQRHSHSISCMELTPFNRKCLRYTIIVHHRHQRTYTIILYLHKCNRMQRVVIVWIDGLGRNNRIQQSQSLIRYWRVIMVPCLPMVKLVLAKHTRYDNNTPPFMLLNDSPLIIDCYRWYV
jgi:hypothetical protein